MLENIPTTTTHLLPGAPHKMADYEFKRSLSETLQSYMDAELGVVDAFVKVRPTMPLQYVRTFLLVARYEGLGVTEYADMVGVSQSVMTRHLLDIGERNRRKEEGFGLVYQKADPMDLRKHRAFLTKDGIALAHAIARALRAVKKIEE